MESCCLRHDRLDLKLTTDEYLDFVCGAPTRPDGEPRYCCGRCPAKRQALVVKANWASNPILMGFLTREDQAEVLRLAEAAGPTVVEIVSELPPQVGDLA